MMKSLTDDVNVLKTLSTNSDINALVKEMFGEAITNLVLTNYAKKLSETRAAGKLNIDPNGVLTTHATGIPVRKIHFMAAGWWKNDLSSQFKIKPLFLYRVVLTCLGSEKNFQLLLAALNTVKQH